MPSVLITGASRGIGLEFVRQYLALNWRVFAAARSPENATELKRLLAKYPDHLSLHPLDVTSTAHIESLAAVLAEFPLDILINNAGVFGDRGLLGEIDYEAFEDVFKVNTLAPLRIVEYLYESLVRGSEKKIVNITSKMGSISDNSSGGRYSYRASKAALNSITKSLAQDLHSVGVTAIVLHPGWVQTDMGGANATRTPQESVAGMRKVIESISLADSGKFYQFDGKEVPW